MKVKRRMNRHRHLWYSVWSEKALCTQQPRFSRPVKVSPK